VPKRRPQLPEQPKQQFFHFVREFRKVVATFPRNFQIKQCIFCTPVAVQLLQQQHSHFSVTVLMEVGECNSDIHI
jgi:hypothetical protein